MSASERDVFTTTVVSTTALTQFRGVNVAGAQAGAAANSLGPAMYTAGIGEAVTVVAMGSAVCEAGAAVALGAALETDALGRYITKAAGVTVGRALTAASAAGDRIEVLLIPN